MQKSILPRSVLLGLLALAVVLQAGFAITLLFAPDAFLSTLPGEIVLEDAAQAIWLFMLAAAHLFVAVLCGLTFVGVRQTRRFAVQVGTLTGIFFVFLGVGLLILQEELWGGVLDCTRGALMIAAGWVLLRQDTQLPKSQGAS